MSETVEQSVIGLTADLIEDWGLDVEVTPQTFLRADLGFDSSDIMQIFTAIHEHYRGVEFKFQELVMKDNKFVDDLTIGQISVFVLRKLGAA